MRTVKKALPQSIDGQFQPRKSPGNLLLVPSASTNGSLLGFSFDDPFGNQFQMPDGLLLTFEWNRSPNTPRPYVDGFGPHKLFSHGVHQDFADNLVLVVFVAESLHNSTSSSASKSKPRSSHRPPHNTDSQGQSCGGSQLHRGTHSMIHFCSSIRHLRSSFRRRRPCQRRLSLRFELRR